MRSPYHLSRSICFENLESCTSNYKISVTLKPDFVEKNGREGARYLYAKQKKDTEQSKPSSGKDKVAQPAHSAAALAVS